MKYINHSTLPEDEQQYYIWDQALLEDFIRKLFSRRDWIEMITGGKMPPLTSRHDRWDGPPNGASFASRIRSQEQDFRDRILCLLEKFRRSMYQAFPGSPHSYVIAHALQKYKCFFCEAQKNACRGVDLLAIRTKLITFWKEVLRTFPPRS